MRVSFHKKMYGGFCQAAKKSDRNNEVAGRRGFIVHHLTLVKNIFARWLVYSYLAALYRIFSPQRKSAIVSALRKASKQSLTSFNTGYALSMAGYYLFGRKTSSMVSRKDVPKILIVITDGRWVLYIVVTFCISLFNN